MSQPLTTPAKSTKDYLREHEARNAELRQFLKAKGCTTAPKRRAAMETAATVQLVEDRP